RIAPVHPLSSRPTRDTALCLFPCFFFQADDVIRAATVTGVQTCALPISPPLVVAPLPAGRLPAAGAAGRRRPGRPDRRRRGRPQIGRASCREREERPASAVGARRRPGQGAIGGAPTGVTSGRR